MEHLQVTHLCSCTVEAYYLTPLYQAAARVIRSNNAKQALCLNRIILSHAVASFWLEFTSFFFACSDLLWFPGQTFCILRLSHSDPVCESCNPVNIEVIFYEGTVWPKIGVDASRLMWINLADWSNDNVEVKCMQVMATIQHDHVEA